jgi:hypothetical protein
MFEEVVTSQLSKLLVSRILDYSVWCLHHNFLRYLHLEQSVIAEAKIGLLYSLGREIGVLQQHHLYEELSFDFETPLKLRYTIILTGS